MASIDDKIKSLKAELFRLTQEKLQQDSISAIVDGIKSGYVAEVRILKSKAPNSLAPYLSEVYVLNEEEKLWLIDSMKRRLEG